MEKLTEKTFKLFSESDSDENLVWVEKDRRRLLTTPIFTVNEVTRESTDKRCGPFVEVASPDWVNIIPVFTGTDNKTYFIMERQFRHGSANVTLEFPSGLVEKGETAEKGALRELWEETGIKANKLEMTGCLNPNPAFMTTKNFFFVASELEYTGQRKLDKNEQIDIVTIERNKLLNLIQKSYLNNVIVITAFFLYLSKVNGIKN